LAEIAARLAYLKTHEPENETDRTVARLVVDERFRPRKRTRLPVEFTGGLEVHSVDLMVERNLLPAGYITESVIHCKAMPGEAGRTWMTPYPKK